MCNGIPNRTGWLNAHSPLRAIGLALLLSAFMSACVSVEEGAGEKKQTLQWPEPPDSPRYVYQATIRNANDIRVESSQDRMRRMALGTGISIEPAFDKPTSIAARRGRIYVTDSVKRNVLVFDIPRGKTFEIGLRPPGNLIKPIGIALDDNGHVYVADTTRRQVLVYDQLGLHLKTIGQPDELDHPSGVAVSPSGDRIYVVDRGSNEHDKHQVLIYDAEGKILRILGPRGDKPGEFNVPVQAAVAPDGTLYVLDAGNFRVQAFDREGNHLRSFGEVGRSIGQFARPRGIAVDPEGNVYVTDGTFANCQVFNPQGSLLLAIGESGLKDAPGRFRLPIGVAVDETNHVFIVDQFFEKIEVLRKLSEEEVRK